MNGDFAGNSRMVRLDRVVAMVKARRISTRGVLTAE